MMLKEFLAASPRGMAASIAAAIGVQPVMVSQWASRVKPVPTERCCELERATEGKVTCEELRADVRWHREADSRWPWHPNGRPLIDIVHRQVHEQSNGAVA